MKEARLRSWPTLTLLLLTGCAGKQVRDVPQVPLHQARAVAFVADGAGGNATTAWSLAHTVQEKGDPLLVYPYSWTHGRGRYVTDQVDTENVLCQGERLAHQVHSWQRQYPTRPVYLLGYSAGSAVILEATRHLRPDTIERIVLLAPAVSASHDIRPALTCARRGMDVFTSEQDWVYLGLVTGILGTTDGERELPAGRRGFRISASCPEDVALYERLRTHPWHPAVAWTGHQGAHFGSYRPRFIEAYVLPLLQP